MNDEAASVLHFWFEETSAEQHFAKDDAFDRTVADRFGALHERLSANAAGGWRDDPDTMLAAIIVLDQFSRNIHRDDARAFANDPLALSIAREGVAKAFDHQIAAERRRFFYMPFMHAEDAHAQAECIRLMEAAGDAESARFARDHADVIDRFGRFPSRNGALKRSSTPEEVDYLSQPDAGW